MPMLLPPLDEQRHIAELLDLGSARISAAVDDTKRQIDFVREYRIRLIADVVTGKLDVRNVVLPEIEDPDDAPLDEHDEEDSTDGENGHK